MIVVVLCVCPCAGRYMLVSVVAMCVTVGPMLVVGCWLLAVCVVGVDVVVAVPAVIVLASVIALAHDVVADVVTYVAVVVGCWMMDVVCGCRCC